MKRWYLVPVIAVCGAVAVWAGPSQQELETQIKDNPHNAELHYKLAETYYKNSIRDENTYDKRLIELAMKEYKKTMDLDPNRSAECLGTLGIIQHELGFMREARDKLERALKLNPDMKEERLILAKIYNNEGVQAIERFDYATGLRKLKIALELNPKLKDAAENLATSYYQLGMADVKAGQFEAGIGKIETAMKHKAYKKVGVKNLRDAYYNWGVSLSQLGYLDKGIAKFEQALEYGKSDELNKSLSVLYCKKAASVQRTDMPAAVAWYKKGIKTCPDKKDRLVAAAENNIKALKQRMSKK